MSDDNRQLCVSDVPGDLSITLCGDEGIQFGNRLFRPNSTRGYFAFQMSYGFPVATHYGTGLHPAVIAKSYETLLDQNINREHQIASYYPDNPNAEDRVVGAIVAASFPQEPIGGWRIQHDTSKAPFISGVGVMFKQCVGIAKMLGDHMSGRRKHQVSMEVFWPLEEAGFAVALNGKTPAFNHSPKDFLESGYEYIPYEHAPEDLRAVWSKKKRRVMAAWKGRKVTVLMGGLGNPVHYAGLGIVQFGAEPPAKIMRLAASAQDGIGQVLDQLGKFAEAWTQKK